MTGASTARDAILECFRANAGGPMSIREVQKWIEVHYADRWKDISTQLADLTIGGNTSSSYRENERFLERVSRGVYRRASKPSQSVSIQAKANSQSAAVVATRASGSGWTGNSSDDPSIFVPGLPATFATAMERKWKAALDLAIPQADPGHTASGLRMTFALEALERKGRPFDLDNLCEPVISVLVNRKGYFGGRRPNIRWWHASRRRSEPVGCRIDLCQGAMPTIMGPNSIFRGTYAGALPRCATDTAIADWLAKSLGSRCMPVDGRAAVGLTFGTASVNLGDIATGCVKAVIDNLFPILGGTIGAPADWRIDELLVAKRTTVGAAQILEIQVGVLNDHEQQRCEAVGADA